ncbi:MAG: HD domain-containing protein [Pseudomonadota bacterium]
MDDLYEFLIELDKLKAVYRRTYLFDKSRHENSAEHSWHLAIAVLSVQQKFALKIDTLHAMKLALVHDICEIDAGDLSVFDTNRQNKYADEKKCIERLAALPESFAKELIPLWNEYEDQMTIESRWVKVLDRLLPFFSNLRTEGATWKDMDVSAEQVRDVMAFIAKTSPEIHVWMQTKIDDAVNAGWLYEKNQITE